MSKTLRSLLSVFISITMVLTVIPFTAIADGLGLPIIETEVESILSDNVEDEKTTADTVIIGELISKRESNVKHFKMSDGSYTAAVYPYDVHFKDANGEFQDIDNSLSSENDGENDVLSNKNNLISVKFVKKSNPNKLYTISKGEHKIKVSIDGVSKVKATEHTTTDIISDDKFVLENIGSKIIYNDILENTDIEFTLKSTELKENIILKEKVNFDSLVYTYHLNGSLTAIQTDSKNIVFYDKNQNFVFNISAPAMWDSEGNYYDDLVLEIIETKNSKIKIKISWNTPENAKYPVTIDPVMSATVDRNQIQDTHIIASNPNVNYDVNNHIRVRNDGYAMLRFPTPTLTSGDKIVNAQLVLAPYGAYDISDAKYSNVNNFNPQLYITSHKILRTWQETTATYSNVNPENGFYDSTTQSYAVVDNNSHYYYWDITRLVNEWTEGYSDNYGLLLKYAASPSDGSIFDSFFCSTNGKYLPVEARPQMLYNYVNTTGIEDYYSYHTQNLGYAGIGYTNDLTGNLTIVNEVYNSGGSLMPISVSLVYNLSNIYKSEAPYGNGWWLNWAQKIDWSVKSNLDNTQYVKYTDGDGTNHFFTVDNSTGIWTDEINPDRKIYFIQSTGDYKITDSSGACMYFIRNGSLNEWYLYKVEDVYGNNITICLNSYNLNRVDSIYSSTGDWVGFDYNENGFLTGVKYLDEGTNKTITIGYNNYVSTPNNCISNIYYPDSSMVQYHYYDTSKYLSKAVDIDGKSIVYNYKWVSPLRVNYIAEYSSAFEMGANITMSYQPTATVFNDVTNNRNYLYTFAQNGTLKSVVDVTSNDGNGYGQYYEYNNGIDTETTGTGNLTFASKTQKSTVNLLKNHSFEYNVEHSFTAWNETSGTSQGEYSSEKRHIGARSYKITRPTNSNSTRALGYYYIYIDGGKTYTLSAYVNTSGMTSNGKGASLLFVDSERVYESEYITETSDEWQRISLTFTANRSEYVSVCMGLSGATGSVYFDNIQLEVGDLSEYNLLENAGFEQVTSGAPDKWGLTSGYSYLGSAEKISGNFSGMIYGGINVNADILQVVSVPNGKKGDTYVASAFAKANSTPADGWKFTLLVRFTKNGDSVHEENILFNSYTTEWQKVAGAAKATGDYDAIQFWLLYYGNANTVFFDNAQLIKDTFGTAYTYDNNGNLITTTELDEKEYTFQYNGNNQLIKQNNISGSKYYYTYDSSKNQQLNLSNAGGITTNYKYDLYGNNTLIQTESNTPTDGNKYYIRYAQNENYLTVYGSQTADGTNVLTDKHYGTNNQIWKLSLHNNGYYSLHPENAPTAALTVSGSADGSNVEIRNYSGSANQLFSIENADGVVMLIPSSASGFAVDGGGENANVIIYTKSADNKNQQWLLESTGYNLGGNNPVITSGAAYNNKGYLTSTTDSRGNKTSYTYNSFTGQLNDVTDAKGNKTKYSYDSADLLKSVTGANSTVQYNYYASKQLKEILSPSGTKYNFAYNSFGRTTDIRVGSRTLSSNVYDNAKGLLDYTTYGNGTLVDYSYDYLGRNTTTSINGVLRYNKIYDGTSNLIAVEDFALNRTVKNTYDLLERLSITNLIERSTGKILSLLKIRYDEKFNRVAGYDSTIGDITIKTDYTYGSGVDTDIITGIKLNGSSNNTLSYNYDSLKRFNSRTINTSTPFETNYTYVSGKRTYDYCFEPHLCEGRTVSGDFNGDGYDDTALMYDYNSNEMRIFVLNSDSNGNCNDPWVAFYATNYNANKVTNRMVAGDFDGDGKDEIAVMYDYGNATMRIHVFDVANGTWSDWYTESHAGWYNAEKATGRITAGDFDGDGKDEIAVMYDYDNYTMKINMFKTNSTNNGFDFYIWYQATQYDPDRVTGHFSAADVDNDGKDDLLALYGYDTQTRIHLFKSNGSAFNGWYDWFVSEEYGFGGNDVKGTFVTGDYNGDGYDDAAVLYNYGKYSNLLVFTANGLTSGNYWQTKHIGKGNYLYDHAAYRLVSGDFDGNGKDSIRCIYAESNSSLAAYDWEDKGGNMYEFNNRLWNSRLCTSTFGNETTTLVKTVKNGDDTLEYAYDELGNITSVKKNGALVESYTYDSLNQLKTVTNSDGTYAYNYDNGGNIKEVYLGTQKIKDYTYGDTEWKDLLTAYNGQTITYDAIGNPLCYRDNLQFTWVDGRKLASITKGTDSISYIYNADGLRTSKTANGTTTEYYWLNGMLQGQKTGSEYIVFLYDENGSAYGFLLKNGTTEAYYYYIFNAQGDVIGIVDSNGTVVVEYTYSAWGEVLSITGTMADTIGQKNPIRYRGYYFDSETGFYYLQSRYYDPVVQRFLNADGVVAGAGGSIGGYNLFSYCFNNPVNLEDDTGNWPKWIEKAADTVKNTVKKVKKAVVKATKRVAAAVEDAYNRTLAIQQQQQMLDNEIRQKQLDGAKAAMDFILETNLQSTMLQEQAYQQQSSVISGFVQDRFSTPEKASNTLSAIGYAFDSAAAYCGGVAAGLSIPTLGMSIPTAGTAAAILVITSLPFHGAALVINIFIEE